MLAQIFLLLLVKLVLPELFLGIMPVVAAAVVLFTSLAHHHCWLLVAVAARLTPMSQVEMLLCHLAAMAMLVVVVSQAELLVLGAVVEL